MDCRTFEERLEALLEGTLDAAARRALLSHRAECPGCARLDALARSEPGPDAEVAPPELTAAILARTSGGGCGRAAELLPDHADRTLGGIDLELLGGHLGGCASCRALERTLRALAADLPGLAEVRPDERFVADVLRRTVPWRRRAARRLAETWGGLVARPRLAAEAGYVGALTLTLLFWTPLSPLAGVPRQAAELARAGPVEKLEQPVAALEDRVSLALLEGWHAARARAAMLRAGLAAETTERLRTWRVGLGTLWTALASEQVQAADDAAAPNEERNEGDQE